MPDGVRPVGPRDPAHRVVVTGWGMVTSLGAGVETTFAAMARGRSGVSRATRIDPTGLPCDLAAEIDLESLAPSHPLDDVGGSAFRLFRTALDEALEGDAFALIEDRGRIAVMLGQHGSSPTGGSAELLAHYTGEDEVVDVDGLIADRSYSANLFSRRLPDTLPALVARYKDARGPVVPIVSACAAGAQAVGEGMRLLRDGRTDAVIAGGVEPLLTYAYYLGFTLLGAMSRRYPSPEQASRPFDRKRNGFVIAEGAGALVLETLEGAQKRSRPILGEILGYGDSSDAHLITATHPEGDGAVLAMRRALADAGLRPDDVDYINAHGTSTPLNDPVETKAIKRVLGDRAGEVPVSSNKSMIGHTIGAAGAIEAILTMVGIREGLMLPTINLDTPDRKCDLDYVPHEARAASHRIALSNSFGFGGQNGCLCLTGATTGDDAA
jgi:3-oxoacyl-[acyl-carrier-protein] synthase II